jgi:hypothetical protein
MTEVALIEISSTKGAKEQRWRYDSRDLAIARVTALFVKYPLADTEERQIWGGTVISLTVES